MGILFPLWALVVPFCLGLFLSLVFKMPGSLPPVITIAVLTTLMAIPVVSIVLSAICEDDRLLVSAEGMSFPLLMLPGLGFRRERLWSDLASVHLAWEGASDYGPGDSLTLFFRSGGKVTLRLRDLPSEDLEQFLLAIEVWGTNCARQAELIAFQNNLQNLNKGLPHLSYTQMWEEELARRFNTTAFVPLEPNKLLKDGHLRIVRQLAFGGLSAIYLAQKDERALVVVKEAVVPAGADSQAKAKALELFEREAELLERLKHEQIAKVLEHFQEEGRNYLLLEYIHGQDLRQFVKQNGPQLEARVLTWIEEITDILEYLHGQDPPIIHRDLTPDNLVLKDDGRITLIDFGAANEFVGTATGTLVGKQSYIAPEQFRGKASTASDLYALGATVYFLLTGEDPEALCQATLDGKADVTPGLREIVSGLTAMDAEKRLQPASKVKQMISQIIDTSAPTAGQAQVI